MLSKQIGTIEHMTCGCGRGASLMAVNVGGGTTKYRAEALCCHMQTVLLLTPQAATTEFGRLRAVIQMDLDAFTAMEKAYAERKNKVRNIRGPK